MTGDERLLADAVDLDCAPVGTELTRGDYAVLAGLGLVVPALLLVWGWV